MNLKTLLVIAAIASIPYLWNGVKLANCDFESSYRCEIVHGVGVVVPPLSYVTVWFDSDSK